MEGERFPSALPEAFECAGCRYDLRGVVPVEGSVVCPECQRATPNAILGTLLAPLPGIEIAKIFCGQAILVVVLGVIGTMGSVGLSLAALVFGIGLPIHLAWSIVRGRKDRRWRKLWFCNAVLLVWIGNVACVFGTFGIIYVLVRLIN